MSMLPEMSPAFVSDVEHILKNMVHWLKQAILGPQSRMRSIINSENENIKSWHTQDGKAITPEQQLNMLANLKINLFDQFARAIIKLLKFFIISKVS